MSLTDFLLARIAEDKASLPGRWDDHWYDDPDRYRREAEAKRRIVEWCGEREMVYIGTTFSRHPDDPPRPDEYIPGGLANPNDAVMLRFLALPYADHPDYRPEWRP